MTTKHERHVTAIHESAHAVAAACMGMKTKYVSIIQLARSDGRHRLSEPASHFSQRQLVTWALSGSVAERLFFRDRDPKLAHYKAADDYQFVRDVLECTGEPDDDVDVVAARYEKLTEALILSNEQWIKAVAARLLTDTSLDDDLIRDLEPVERRSR